MSPGDNISCGYPTKIQFVVDSQLRTVNPLSSRSDRSTLEHHRAPIICFTWAALSVAIVHLFIILYLGRRVAVGSVATGPHQ